MQVVTPAELKQFMDSRGLTVTDIVADTKLHSNTIYRFLNGKVQPNQSTEETLTRWKLDRETGRAPSRRAAVG